MKTEKRGFQMGVNSMGDALDGTRAPVQETWEREQKEREQKERTTDTEPDTGKAQ